MIGRGGEWADYKVVLNSRSPRRELLYRAALATALIVLMAIGLTLYDSDEPPAPAAQAVPASAPLAVPPAAEAPAYEPRAEDTSVATQDAGADSGELRSAEAQAGVAGEPGMRAQETAAGDEPAGIGDAGAALGSAQSPPPRAPAPAPAAQAAVPEQAPIAAAAVPRPSPASRPAASQRSGFQLQIGNFGDGAAASALGEELSAQGHAVRVQRRIAVGMFPQRKAAEEALARLGREYALRGLVVAVPSGDGFIVQVGVFNDAGNAENLSRRLLGDGYRVLEHGRVMVGPFPDRKAAESALTRLAERRIVGVVVAHP